MSRAESQHQDALREAAMAVIAHRHGLRVNRLHLVSPETGHELLDTLRYGLDLDRRNRDHHFFQALKHVEVALAGQVAVEHYLSFLPAAGDAEALAAELLDQLCGSMRQQEALRTFARARLLDLLDLPVNRGMIEELAAQLETEGELDRDQFMLVTLRTVKLPL